MSVVAFVVLCASFTTTLLIVMIGRLLPRRRWQPSGRIAVTGTFHNPNWFASHATPLAQCGMEEAIFVVDEPQIPIDGIRFVHPPRWVLALLGRTVSKALWMIVISTRARPDVYIGYHIFPNALIALTMGALFGRPACYQMCAGPLEVAGGGVHCENRLMTKLRRPSPFLERLALAVVRRFQSVVVRGNRAASYLRNNGVRSQISIIPGSIKLQTVGGSSHRDTDLIFVGRLSEIKQPLQVIDILEGVRQSVPDVRMRIVGNGPLMGAMRARVTAMCLDRNVEMLGQRSDIEELLGHARIFILTSRSEGLSIAMAEAMACGCVPVVSNVGELADLVVDGVNGCLCEPNCTDVFAEQIIRLLVKPALWQRLSAKAIKTARSYNGIDVVSSRWRECLLGLLPAETDPVTKKWANRCPAAGRGTTEGEREYEHT